MPITCYYVTDVYVDKKTRKRNIWCVFYVHLRKLCHCFAVFCLRYFDVKCWAWMYNVDLRNKRLYDVRRLLLLLCTCCCVRCSMRCVATKSNWYSTVDKSETHKTILTVRNPRCTKRYNPGVTDGVPTNCHIYDNVIWDRWRLNCEWQYSYCRCLTCLL